MKYITLLACLTISFSSTAQESLNMPLLDTWSDGSLTATSAHNNTYNEVWGYVQGGKEYGIIGSTHGTHIIDVTDPSNISEAVFIEGNQPSVQYPQVVHRDYHTYKNYLYMVSDEGTTNLKIADLSSLPTSAPVVYNSNALFTNSHNIFIDTTTAKLYVCGASNQFAVYDLTDPINPTHLYDNISSSASWSDDMGYVHDVYVRNDTAYMNAGPNGMFVTDFSTSTPTFLGSITTYPHSGYNHSGWLSPKADFYILADENHGKDLKTITVSDLTDMSTITTFNNEIDPDRSIPHNVIIKDDLAYVSYYFDGIYAFDVSDPSAPYIKGFYDTSSEINQLNFRGCWGIYPYLPSGIILASDMQNGLFVFDGDDLLNIKENTYTSFETRLHSNFITNELIILSNSDSEKLIEIYSISGQIIMEQKINSHKQSINFDNQPSGIYFAVIKVNNTTKTFKFIKE